MHWEALPRLTQGDSAVLLWFICTSSSFLSLKETVAVHLKRAILLLNLELKIPGGAAHGLCSLQVGGSLMCQFLTGLARGKMRNCVRIAPSPSPLPRVTQYAEAQLGGVYIGHEILLAGSPCAASRERPDRLEGNLCRGGPAAGAGVAVGVFVSALPWRSVCPGQAGPR